MTSKETRATIIVALITAAGVIIAAYVPFFPWTKKNDTGNKLTKTEYYITGTIIDAETNANVEQAEINIVGRNEQDYSEHNGNFKIEVKDSIGVVRLRVTKKGYLMYDESVNLPNEGRIIQLSKKD